MIFGFNAHDEPPEAYIDYAVRHELTHIELDLIKDHSNLESFDKSRTERLLHTATQAGVTFSLHAPYTIDLLSRMPLRRRADIAYLEECVLLTARLQGTHVTLHVGQATGFPIWPWKRFQYLETLRRALRKLKPVCEQHGVPLALENASTSSVGSGVCCLGDCVDDFSYLFDGHDSVHLKLCLDVGHANTNEGPCAFIRALGERLVSVHCHDNLGKADQHLAIGRGTVPWLETLETLRNAGYEGPHIGECFDQPPHETAACLMRILSEPKK